MGSLLKVVHAHHPLRILGRTGAALRYFFRVLGIRTNKQNCSIDIESITVRMWTMLKVRREG